MNIRLLVTILAPLVGLSSLALAQTKPSNPKRWKKPYVNSGREDVRCLENPANPDPGGSDAIPSHSSEAQTRVNWATDTCEHIDKKHKQRFTHYYDYDEGVFKEYPVGSMKFPSFAENDSQVQPQEKRIFKVWKPEYRTCSLHVPSRKSEAIWYTVCQQGCYPKGQKVKFDKGRYLDIADAVANDAKFVTVINPNSSLSQPEFKQIEVASYTADPKPAEQSLLEFKTESGKSIIVTPNHFLVVGDGRVIEAQLIQPDQSLLNQFGKPEKIVEIRENKEFFGRTYNVAPKSHDPLDNIVVAQGFLSGSHRYQTGTISALNRKIGQNLIPANLLDDLN